MKAAVYHAAGDVRLEDLERPVPGPGELLVEMRACGICGSDLSDWYIEPRAPVVLGHEPVGVILETGADGKAFFNEASLGGASVGPATYAEPGQRVFVHHHVPCLQCELCRRGHETLCETFRGTRILPGGFSELILVPAQNAALDVLAIPDHVSDAAATAIEPLACVLRGQRIAGVGPGSRVLLLGGGQIGMLQALAARAAGADVLIAEPLAARRAFAEQLGFCAVAAEAEALRDALGGQQPTAVILCTSAAGAWELAITSVGKGGTVQLFATIRPGEERSFDAHELFFGEITIQATYSAGPADTRAALALIASGAVPSEQLVTHRFELADTAAALAMARGKEAVKVIVTNSAAA